MMALHVRAVYEHGLLRPLSSVNLEEGQEVGITIEPTIDEELLRQVLKGHVRWNDPTDNRYEEVEALAEEIAQIFGQGQPLSEIIIEERGER